VVDTTMDRLSWVRKQVEDADTDLLREMVKLFCERVMSEEADAICGAPYGERSEDRTNRRNGYRTRAWDTRTGTIDLAVPKLREGILPGLAARAPSPRPSERSFRWSASPTSGASPRGGSRASSGRSGSSGSPSRGCPRWPRNSISRSKPSALDRSTALRTRTSGSMPSPRRCVRAAGSATSRSWSPAV
jgi:hypothetical protein